LLALWNIGRKEILVGHWCGEHRPENDVCVLHGLRWKEFHNEELKDEHDISAIFYCPVYGCDNFELDSESQILASTEPLRTTIRVHILFHKLGEREGDGK